MNTLDFETNKVLNLSLEDLKRTYKENDVLGRPLMGIYHYEMIERVLESIKKSGYDVEISEIFAAQNKDKLQPGVVLNPALEQKYGERAVEAHVLRRVYANIAIHDFDNEEYGTNVAVSFHQKGIALAYGPMVHICHNQCILNADRIININRQNPLASALEQFEDMMLKLPQAMKEDSAVIERMKLQKMSHSNIAAFVGMLTFHRVAHDSKDSLIRLKECYPLSNSQINQVAEDLLKESARNQEEWNMWKVYNVCTNVLKADRMEIPEVISQHLSLTNLCKSFII